MRFPNETSNQNAVINFRPIRKKAWTSLPCICDPDNSCLWPSRTFKSKHKRLSSEASLFFDSCTTPSPPHAELIGLKVSYIHRKLLLLFYIVYILVDWHDCDKRMMIFTFYAFCTYCIILVGSWLYFRIHIQDHEDAEVRTTTCRVSWGICIGQLEKHLQMPSKSRKLCLRVVAFPAVATTHGKAAVSQMNHAVRSHQRCLMKSKHFRNVLCVNDCSWYTLVTCLHSIPVYTRGFGPKYTICLYWSQINTPFTLEDLVLNKVYHLLIRTKSGRCKRNLWFGPK